jgi:hypothetical protein
MVLVLRSFRAQTSLYGLDARIRRIGGLGPAEPESFARRFEVGIYCSMCFGTGLVVLGLVVAAT